MTKRMSGAPGCYCLQLVDSTCDFCSGLRTLPTNQCSVEGCERLATIPVPNRPMAVCKHHAEEGIGLAEMTLKSWKLGMPEPLAFMEEQAKYDFEPSLDK
jgi:hypothetical protein